MTVCAITGTLRNASETGYVNAVIRLTPEGSDAAQGQAEIDAAGSGFVIEPVEVRSGAGGAFTINASQGVRYRLEIPALGFDRSFICPAVATITFARLAYIPVIESVADYTDLDTGDTTATVTVRVEPIRTVIRLWESVVVQWATSRAGPWTELDELPLSDEVVLYTVTDTDSAPGNFYRALYRTGVTDGPVGLPRETASTEEAVLMTPDELRELYLFGIDLTDDFGRPYSDRMLEHYIRAAIDWLHEELDIPILEQRFTDEMQDHVASDYGQWGYFQLQNYPVTVVEEVAFQYPSMTQRVVINDDWIVLQEAGAHGVINIVPGQGNIADVLLIPGQLMPLWSGATGRVPGVWRFTYRAGFRAGSLPANVKDVIGMRASLGILDIAGDLVAGAGIANLSIGVPGLNQSVGTTASATNAGYGARILSYNQRLKETLPILRQFYGKRTRMVVA